MVSAFNGEDDCAPSGASKTVARMRTRTANEMCFFTVKPRAGSKKKSAWCERKVYTLKGLARGDTGQT
jgi:hypothetical protein